MGVTVQCKSKPSGVLIKSPGRTHCKSNGGDTVQKQARICETAAQATAPDCLGRTAASENNRQHKRKGRRGQIHLQAVKVKDMCLPAHWAVVGGHRGGRRVLKRPGSHCHLPTLSACIPCFCACAAAACRIHKFPTSICSMQKLSKQHFNDGSHIKSARHISR